MTQIVTCTFQSECVYELDGSPTLRTIAIPFEAPYDPDRDLGEYEDEFRAQFDGRLAALGYPPGDVYKWGPVIGIIDDVSVS